MPTMLTLVALGLLVGASAPPPQAQPAPAGVVTGVVVDGVTGSTIAGAIVTINAIPGLPKDVNRRQITDERGRFAFTRLPPDAEFTFEAVRQGYLPGGLGRDVSPADPLRPVRLPPGGWLADQRVTLWKPGSIGGVVRDENGEPVVGVLVRVLARLRLHGRDELAAGPMTVTDDRGAYRVGGLSPGRYIVQVPSVQSSIPAATTFSARGPDPEAAIEVDDTSRLVIGRYPMPPPPLNGRPRAYPMAFHPGAITLADASVIEMKFGEDRSGVDVALTPVAAVRVSGVVQGPPEAMSFLTLRLLPAGLERLGQGAEAATALVAADGSFTFLNVAAGTYTIDAPSRIAELTIGGASNRASFPVPPGRYGWQRQSQPLDGLSGLQFWTTDFRAEAGALYSGRSSITVDASEMRDVVVPLRKHSTMSGRITTETLKGPPPPTSFDIRLDPATGDPSHDMPRVFLNSVSGGSGAFSMAGLKPARYWLRVILPAGWIIKSIMWKGQDYTRAPFDATATEDFSGVEVLVTDSVPELTGTVRGTDDQRPERAMVVAFPVNPEQWQDAGLVPAHMKIAPVAAGNTYRFTSLPAGDYFVVAIDRALLATWRDPDVLAQLQRSAARVTLPPGRATSVDVSVAAIRR